MTAPEHVRYSTDWLDLREQADARARSRELAAHVARDLCAGAALIVHDLGSGTGSMGRWLAPLVPCPQQWVLHDRDPDLLDVAAARPPRARMVTVGARRGDVADLTPSELAGAGLVTASALLDLLTAAEVDGLAAACDAVRCPALITLTVDGRVEIDPPDPLDVAIAASFDAHQHRLIAGRQLLGPDAVPVAAASFRRRGARVDVRPSPWRLGPEDAALIAGWLRGWVEAAGEQRPELHAGDRLDAYLDRRLAEAADGALHVTVSHEDLLARWS
jgi:hypothetical protein